MLSGEEIFRVHNDGEQFLLHGWASLKQSKINVNNNTVEEPKSRLGGFIESLADEV